ncbi:UPF0115 protein YfcN [Buchnera aphidicola (Phyllaphis fagi)]|uniref:endonuclease SmrB n=1 Tax=Buchnera aphidicola TaxID=9 RepID=UPI003463FBB1
MKKNRIFCSKDNLSFYECFQKIRKMKQDTIFHNKSYELNRKKYYIKKIMHQQDMNIYFFNYNTSYNSIQSNPVSYIKSQLFYPELQKLKNRKYISDIYLDLHGLNQNHAQRELSKLIFICHKKQLSCCSIIHGHGKNILKYQIPIWLSKHPDVIAFYQVPKLFGYNTTLSVLMKYVLQKNKYMF